MDDETISEQAYVEIVNQLNKLDQRMMSIELEQQDIKSEQVRLRHIINNGGVHNE